MEKKKNVSEVILDEESINEPQEKVAVFKVQEEPGVNVEAKPRKNDGELINCLTNEIVIVRFIAKARGNITDPRHILYGNMAPNSKIKFPVPMLRSGFYADVLTNDEKNFLESKLGLEPGALGVYRKTDNFWDDSNPHGIGRVELIKGDNLFDKSKPLDYIKLAILRKYDDIIAPSMQVLQDKPKATYRFVMINESDSAKAANSNITRKAQAYKLWGKMEEDREKLRVIIEIIEGKPVAANTKLEFLQGKVGDIIESNTKLFLNVANDPLLDNKVLIKKAIEAGIVANRGNYLFYKENNMPLCRDGEDPTLNNAAKFLSLPKNQELKFTIEAKIKEWQNDNK